MVRITGIGGFFFRAEDPKALADWYHRHFGILPVPGDYDKPSWRQEAGTTVFAPFPDETEHFGRPDQPFMLNFRVPDLAAAVAELRDAGIAVELDPESYPNGLFARLEDPEGNPIELWEPRGNDV